MFSLMEIPYELTALEPYISRRTLRYHYHKHHQGYVDKLNTALEKNGISGDDHPSLEHLISQPESDVYNLAAQVWNHQFYWQSLKPRGGSPSAKFEKRLAERFGSSADFLDEIESTAKSQFGSGWAWLVSSATGDLDIITTSDAGNPMTQGQTPLLTIDVWEHAYYLDYQNDRGAYLNGVLNHLLNWEFAEHNDIFASSAAEETVN